MKIANHNDQHLCHREEQTIEERSIIDLQPWSRFYNKTTIIKILGCYYGPCPSMY